MSHVLTSGSKFDTSLDKLEDWDFWLQLSRGATLAESGRATCVYVVTNRSGVGTPGYEQRSIHTQLLNKWMHRLSIEAYATPLTQLANRLSYLEDVHRELSGKLGQSEQVAEAAKQQVFFLANKAADAAEHIAQQSDEYRKLTNTYRADIASREQECVKTSERHLAETLDAQKIKAQLDAFTQASTERVRSLEQQLKEMRTSSFLSMKFFKPFLRILREAWLARFLRRQMRRAVNGVGYLARGDLQGFNARLKSHFSSSENNPAPSLDAGATFRILTTKHALFVAELLRDDLVHLGYGAEIVFEFSAAHHATDQMYFVLCAQMFNLLPRGDRRIVVQLEQLTNSNWHSSAYFSVLEGSLAVLEFSQTNLAALDLKGLRYPHVFYLPLGPRLNVEKFKPRGSATSGTLDFLFYGSWKPSKRRQQILDELERKGFGIDRIDNSFGNELTKHLLNAKAVVNIHYDAQNVMEAPRIFECLSLGVPVISEPSSDSDDYSFLTPALSIATAQSSPALADSLLGWKSPDLEAMLAPLDLAQEVHRFHFFRLMFACSLITPDWDKISYPLPQRLDANVPVVLSLPETFRRRQALVQQWPEQIPRVIFNGIRHRRGWIGCALSYRTLARWALAQDLPRLIVAEDDVSLPIDFSQQLPRLLSFLERVDQPWDVYCGLIAVVDDPVICLKRFSGLDLGHDILLIDRFKSMVFNVFNRSALEHLAAWNPDAGDEYSNTIDVYLDRKPNIRTLVSCPFLVGHAQELHSTLWGIENTTYDPLIADTQAKLDRLQPQG